MATHMFQTSPGGKIGPDTTLAPPAVIETDPNTRHVPSMLRIHIQDAKLPAGCNPYAVVSVGNNCARSKQLLSAENPALASTGHAFFDEQFVVEYDPKHMKETFVSVAFFERTTNAPLGEWRAPISDFDHHHHGILSHLPGKHQTDAGGHSWELIEGTNVPLAPYVGTALPHGHAHGHAHGGGLLSHLKPGHSHATTTTPVATVPVATTAPVATATAPVVATTPVLGTAVPVATTTPIPATTTPFVATTTPVGAAAPVTSAPMGTGVLGTAHIRVRSEPKLIGTLKLGVKEVILATGSIEPIILNIKFASPEQRFSTPLTPGVTGGRFAFTTNEFFLHVDPSNNVRDIFIEVMQNGVILGETRVTLYDAYRPGGLAAAQPILIHSTKSRIGEILLSSSFDGKVQKR